jgi:nucleoside-diphosphate-sugar epimerase
MIALTGSTGFVGKNLSFYLKNCKMALENISRQSLSESNFRLSGKVDTVVHLAGKAHDLKNTSSKDEYYEVNTELTKKIFDLFLKSNASVFITLSSVKAAADKVVGELKEDYITNPSTHYGMSKLLAEEYILSKQIPADKRIYILRPCMIHGPRNKGNLNLLYKIVSKGFPWPLGAFDNKRSFCSIDNLCFVINELIQNDQIPSGVYNIADDEALSTNELIRLLAESQGKKPFIINTPKLLVKSLSKLGDVIRLPLNTERLSKLTESYIVSNQKLKNAINKPLPVPAKEGLLKTFNSFNNAQ